MHSAAAALAPRDGSPTDRTPPRAPRTQYLPAAPSVQTHLPGDVWGDVEQELSVRKTRAGAKRTVDRMAKRKKCEQAQMSRRSDRLRAKESATYEDMSTKATRLKTPKNELSKCTKELKVQVKRRGLLRKHKLSAADLRAMASTVSLSVAATASLNQVLSGSK